MRLLFIKWSKNSLEMQSENINKNHRMRSFEPKIYMYEKRLFKNEKCCLQCVAKLKSDCSDDFIEPLKSVRLINDGQQKLDMDFDISETKTLIQKKCEELCFSRFLIAESGQRIFER